MFTTHENAESLNNVTDKRYYMSNRQHNAIVECYCKVAENLEELKERIIMIGMCESSTDLTKQAIINQVNDIDNAWILNQIMLFIDNIQK